MSQVREILAGRYELHEVLGRGGMGVVHRATDQVLGRSVAIKLLPLDRADDPAFVARFEREALAAAVVSHPNIVAIYDSGRDGQTRFIVMECVSGQDLSQLLRQRGPLPAGETVNLGVQIASALAAAHSAGVIHRDIKPANIMVNDAGTAKVLDFGIARSADSTQLTSTANIIGSASYLAPELAHGASADERSDIYALGCVLYELLSGRPPFRGESVAAILHQHANTLPQSLTRPDARVPPGLNALVLAMLAKDPAARPQPAAELVAALPEATATERLEPTQPQAAVRAPQRRRRRRLAPLELTGLLVAAMLIIGGTVAALASSGGQQQHAATQNQRRTTPVLHTSTPTTVAGAADALRSLITRDLDQRQIDQQAYQQIANRLTGIVMTYRDGNPADALHHAQDLAAQIPNLQEQGHIQDAAAPAITGAIDHLIATLERAAPPQTTTGPAGQAVPAHPEPTAPEHPNGHKHEHPSHGHHPHGPK